ncbi:hypothetical protein SH591_13185 [Sphingomonas sp. LY54]|uniref:hypothetical protein n=1 Tax=Sphingomonadales TaxID=204457 RepID=UPI002ADECA62|nr:MULTISPECIES: hypothetical protein [Sphingomonadales]MEA1015690.1 hypothetical protein [Sphingosinicella sp. LY1275]WRP28049.1 hypothetical protein SH591_13185 [Sphingomonas sp. LY54]
MHKNRILAAASVAALLSLAACGSEPETITGNASDPQAKALAKAKPVELPPAIQASRTYRCKDNSLFYADFYTNNTVHVGAERAGPKTTLTAPAAGEAYVAEGYSLSGNGTEVTYTAPGKGTQSCKA